MANGWLPESSATTTTIAAGSSEGDCRMPVFAAAKNASLGYLYYNKSTIPVELDEGHGAAALGVSPKSLWVCVASNRSELNVYRKTA